MFKTLLSIASVALAATAVPALADDDRNDKRRYSDQRARYYTS